MTGVIPLFLFTFNCNRSALDHDELVDKLVPMLPTQMKAMYVFGFQEVSSILEGCFAEMVNAILIRINKALLAALTRKYRVKMHTISIHHMGSVGMVAITPFASRFGKVLHAQAACGHFGSSMKGGVALRVGYSGEDSVEELTVAVVHLNAGEGEFHYAKRNLNMLQIARSLEFEDGWSLLKPGSHCVVMGDLNYRTTKRYRPESAVSQALFDLAKPDAEREQVVERERGVERKRDRSVAHQQDQQDIERKRDEQSRRNKSVAQQDVEQDVEQDIEHEQVEHEQDRLLAHDQDRSVAQHDNENEQDVDDRLVRDRSVAHIEGLVAQHDELTAALRCGDTLAGFNEGCVDFKPTYKLVHGTAIYNRKRSPAWCDRILYQSTYKDDLQPQIARYGSIANLLISDHQPVFLEIALPLHAPESIINESSGYLQILASERPQVHRLHAGQAAARGTEVIVSGPTQIYMKRTKVDALRQAVVRPAVDAAIGHGLWLTLTRRGRFHLLVFVVLVGGAAHYLVGF